MSDPAPDERPGLLEDRVNDIATLMDTVGSERAAIMGLSETGAVALLFAATYQGERELRLCMDRSRIGRQGSDLPVGTQSDTGGELERGAELGSWRDVPRGVRPVSRWRQAL
jgi:pimeloyl-ACP methyl ester carboxylesterase